LTSPLVAANAFLTNIGATGVKAASAAPLFSKALRLKFFAAIPIDCCEFFFSFIVSPLELNERDSHKSVRLNLLKSNGNIKNANFSIFRNELLI
jgi:hypothetical protein